VPTLERLDVHALRDVITTFRDTVRRHAGGLNRLNVYPVPDGDTGTNMWLTMRHAYNEIAHIEEPHVGRLSSALAEGALRGARGNSGVILSQLWAGVAEALDGQETLDAELLAHATRLAVDKAYQAVEKPVEGTILTVSREMMEAVTQRYDTTPNLIALLRRMLMAGRISLRKTPDLLPVLKKAGVVDSGGQGLLLIFEGMLRSLCGRDVMEEATRHAYNVPQTTWQDALEPEDTAGYGYDVQFLMRGTNLSIENVRHALAEMGGWSTLVVGDPRLIKVHVHMHDPGKALSYAIGTGANIDDVVVENMQEQYEHYVQERTHRELAVRTDIEGAAVITVASGAGLRAVFEQFGAAHVIEGGPTMNPSTGDFMEAIDALPNAEIILLPNNKNVLLAAQQAAAAAPSKHVAVIPSMTIPQGVAALFEYGNFAPDSPFNAIVDSMTASLSCVATCEITRATRTVDLGDVCVREDQLIGLLNDVLVAAGDDMATLAHDLLEKAEADNYERITLYYGIETDEVQANTLAQRLKERFTEQELEVVNGGQALYPYIISVE
jgi:hypothetical protein